MESDDIPDALDQDIAKAIETISQSRPSARGIARKRAKEFRLIGRKHGYQAVADIINRHAERPVTARTAEQFVSQKLREDEAHAEDEAKQRERSRPKASIPVRAVDLSVKARRQERPHSEEAVENVNIKSDDI